MDYTWNKPHPKWDAHPSNESYPQKELVKMAFNFNAKHATIYSGNSNPI